MWLARRLVVAVPAALLCLSSFATAAEIGVYFALTDKGGLLSATSRSTRWTLQETDPNIRFLHAARHTAYKVLKNGTILARNSEPGFSPYEPWQSLGRDANVTSRSQLTGGDNLLNREYDPDQNTFADYDARLYKLSGGDIYRWTGTVWSRWFVAAEISGRYYLRSHGVPENFRLILNAGIMSDHVVGRILHRGGKRHDWRFFYELTTGAPPYNLVAASPADDAHVVWTINGEGDGEYVGQWSAERDVLYAGWGIDDEDNDKREDVWRYAARARQWTFVESGYLRGLAAANLGNEVAVLRTDGTVRIHACPNGDPCTSKVPVVPAGHVVTQVVAMTAYEP